MSEHLALRSSVGSRSSALPPYHHRGLPPPQHADPLNSSRTPPPPPPATPLRSPGFGPFRWSPRPLRGAPHGAWDAVNAAAASPSHSGGGPPMLSPFFRLPAPSPPVTDIGEFSPTMRLIEVGSSSGSGSGSSGFPGLSSRMIAGGSTHATPFAMGVAGAAYPSRAVDMVPIRTLHDGFSHWNMGRFRRNTATSSISPIGVEPGNFGKKRNANSNNFLPLKFRKMNLWKFRCHYEVPIFGRAGAWVFGGVAYDCVQDLGTGQQCSMAVTVVF
uniref:Uncharacterized protein n=1 Tax=Leersia perrieri TaxID=77586 RepID=A0A0D9VXL3_9ORYZ